MLLKLHKPKQALNKAYLKEKLVRSEIDFFKSHFKTFLQNTQSNKSDEEHLKAQIAYFLRDTFYKETYHINPIGKNDLVIHNGKSTGDAVGVIIEAKSLTNKAEMLTLDKPNAKAFHELVLYYLRQRLDEDNNKLKYLVATNIDDWFLFDANEFDKKIYRNSTIKKIYETKKNDGKDNPWFYDELKKTLENQQIELETTHFNIREFEKAAFNDDKKDDKKLIAIYKLLSPIHLLKLPFANDSNSLQPKFYVELLHLIGLTEVKEGSKKLIQRKNEGERDLGSLLENTIIELDSHDKISRLQKPSAFGENHQERLFNVALELVITWINRILFLKLLEAQLVSYHKGAKNYRFLNKEKIKDFDDLDKLFFRVLAKKPEERNEAVQSLFGNVPYLNSSLFEPTELEHETLFIHGLEDRVPLPIINTSVLKDANGKTLKGSLDAIDYLFAFLDAYDFSSEGAEEIQEDNKTLINASVLGLIFEKINGYKDGSFFTPGFITMYMCRETIRRAVVQQFNEAKGWDVKEYKDLYNEIEDIGEANTLINNLKICDPAVGSGHFLVSALNEMIAIKSDLNILCDRQGRRLKEYEVLVENDELIVTDEEGNPFEYNPNNKESQRIQETLFHEKQTIIENCLFGVDINPNSVKICRLRLWIELLKNAYYKTKEMENGGFPTTDSRQLETLPNIDINIKTGNSLISRFALDADLKQALKKSKFSIDAYKIAVQTYRNAKDKEEKREMEKLIATIKSDFRSEISKSDPKLLKLNRLGGELFNLTKQQQLFGESKAEAKIRKAKVEKLEKEVNSLTTEVEEIKSNKIYENAFEWRFEFPDVLNDEGDFIGFDVVIGNPPYGRYLGISENVKKYLRDSNIYGSTGDVAEFFIKMVSNGLLKNNYVFAFIVPKGLSYVNSWGEIRELFLEKNYIQNVIDTSRSFSEAAYEMMIFITTNKKSSFVKAGLLTEDSLNEENIPIELYKKGIFFFGIPKGSLSIVNRINKNSIPISTFYDFWYGKGGMTPKINTHGNGIKVLTGKEVQKYYVKEITDKWFLNPNELNSLDIEKSKRKKVVVQDIVSHIINPLPHIKLTATIDKSENFCLNTVMCFSSKSELSEEFLLGVINSKLMSFYFYYFVFNQAIRTMHFMPGYADRLPLIETNFNHNKIKNKVSQILNIKKINPEEDTITLEKEIDQLVYELYGLTEEEIKIVEGV